MTVHETQLTVTEQPIATVAEIPLGSAVEVLPIYHKCLNCPDLGKICTGQKLAALGSTDAVRNYHRLLRSERKIPLSKVYTAAPQIGHGTINDYFGRGSQDFKWTTVASIDSALVAICGDRVGLPPLDGFCPADVSDLRSRNESLASRLNEAEAEIARLTETLRTAESSHVLQMREQRTVFQSQIDFAVERMQEADRRAADYLSRNDAKSRQLDEARAEIRALNAQIIKIVGDNATEVRSLVDRFIRMADLHAEEVRTLTKTESV